MPQDVWINTGMYGNLENIFCSTSQFRQVQIAATIWELPARWCL